MPRPACAGHGTDQVCRYGCSICRVCLQASCTLSCAATATYDFVWYLGGQIPCNVGHLRARMTQTGHWAQGRELDSAQPRQLLQQRFQEVDFDQARRDIRPFIRDGAELK